MVSLKFSLYVCLALVDFAFLLDLRKLVYSFLLSKHNIKGAKKIHQLQKKSDRLSLLYIKEHTKYPRQFRVFQKMWIVSLNVLLPQYMIIIAIHVWFNNGVVFALIAFLTVKLVMCAIVASQFNSHRISKYDKRYPQK